MSKIPEIQTRPTVIEKTSKRYKGMLLLGVGLFVLGILSARSVPSAIATLSVMAGAGLVVWSKLGAWWNHG